MIHPFHVWPRHFIWGERKNGSKDPRNLPLSACLTVPRHPLCRVMRGPTIPFTKRLQRGGYPTGSLKSEPLRWHLLNRRSMER